MPSAPSPLSPRLLANLGMYDFEDVRRETDAIWSHLAQRLRLGAREEGSRLREELVPVALERDLTLPAIWRSERLLFGQTCGYPFAAHLRDTLRVIGAPIYEVEGAHSTEHASFIVVPRGSSVRRLDELRGKVAAINDPDSNTGRQLFGDALADAGLEQGPVFEKLCISGGHAASVALVAAGRADVAAIDCVSYAHLERVDPHSVGRVRIVARTRRTPALPFVVSRALGEDVARLVAAALRDVFASPVTASSRVRLFWKGMEPIDESAYDVTARFAARADRVFADTPVEVVPPT